MTNKIAMRRRLGDAGVPQPRFAAVRNLHEGRAALATVGLPAVLKPADSGGQRGVFRLDSADDLERHLHAALAESSSEEAIVESFHDGIELNGLVIAARRPGRAADALRPAPSARDRLGVGWIHVYPSTIYGHALEQAEQAAVRAVRTLGLKDGIAFPQIIVSRPAWRGSSRSPRGSRAARWPTSHAMRPASTFSRSRFARRWARRCPMRSRALGSSSRSRSGS